MASNGAGVELVVDPEVWFGYPALSPDGQSVAYTAALVGGGYVCVVRGIESGAEFRIRHPAHRWCLDPAWSPNGRQIAYTDDSDLYIVSVDPVNPQHVQITHDGNFNEDPSWSPDGRQIAFTSVLDGNQNIFAIDTDGRNRIRFTNHPSDERYPDWSPDGRHIAFMRVRDASGGDIYTVNTRTFVATQVTDGQAHYLEPSWSPDGHKIAFCQTIMGKGDICIINADGTGLTNITNTPDKGEYSPDWQ